LILMQFAAHLVPGGGAGERSGRIT
jgi:hypothetical protein